MQRCPNCDKLGAYIGFSSIECSNPNCKHYVPDIKRVCICCGKVGHPDCSEFETVTEEVSESTVSGDAASSGGSGGSGGSTPASEPIADIPQHCGSCGGYGCGGCCGSCGNYRSSTPASNPADYLD